MGSRGSGWLGGGTLVVPRASRRVVSGAELRSLLAELDVEDLEVLRPWCGAELASSDLVEAVARAVEAGELDVFERGAASFGEGMSPVVGAEVAPADWDDAPRLSDLRRDEPSVWFGWISIELLDATGRPFAGQSVTVILPDGTRERAVLDARGRWTRQGIPVPEGGRRVRVVPPARLELDDGQRTAEPVADFRRLPSDVPVPRRGATEIELPQMQRHYRMVVRPAARWVSA